MRLFEFDTSYNARYKRLKAAYNLALDKSTTDGERANGLRAFEQLLKVIYRDFGEEAATQSEKKVKSEYGKTEYVGRSRPRREPPKEEPPKKEPPKKEPPRQKGKSSSGAAPGSNYTHTSGWTFTILRFTDPSAGKRGSDKVWGYASDGRRHMSFWGAFGKTIQSKELSNIDVVKKYQQKVAKGYQRVDANPIDYGYIFTQSDRW